MNLDFLTKLLGVASLVLPVLGGAIQLVTHIVGSDKHKTVAGDLAEKLVEAGKSAGELRGALLNGVTHGSVEDVPS